MKKTANLLLIQGLLSLTFLTGTGAQNHADIDGRYVMDNLLDASPVRDQGMSGTCWSYAAVSFLESELIRTGKGLYDLSEMYAVRAAYLAKAEKYVRMHGTINFGEGGEANDVTDVMELAGMVPESVFPGPDFDIDNFDFGGMDRALKDYVDQVIGSAKGDFDPDWKLGFEAILDRYMGAMPHAFEWQGKPLTPLSFAASLGLTMDDYVLIGSYLHHPYYTRFILEIPDNWSWESVYNVPLDVMMEVLDRSLDLGFTVVWAADISEPGFSFETGQAVIAEEGGMMTEGNRQPFSHGSALQGTADGTEPGISTLPVPVTPELRQEAFDLHETQDDHAMHIIGKAHDRDGNRYYYIKNSWGDDNPLEGHLFASEDYLRYKTISLLINRNALEPELLIKLGIR